MQNHLLQVMLWFAMEPPSSLSREAVQREKCKLLKAVKTLRMEDVFLGQFGRGTWTEDGNVHEEPGYLDDQTVPAGSTCPTYAALTLQIDNDRWRGVPFMMRAGKGLDERMAEVRVTFKEQAFNKLFNGSQNELVMRIQPDEAIYLKCMNKVPGWEQQNLAPVVMDMTYKTSFSGSYVADAYERMFLNAVKGDGTIFVGQDELVEAWRIFTPLLNEIDVKKPQPVIYPFGSRVPPGMDAYAKERGIVMGANWEELLVYRGQQKGLEALFKDLDFDGSGGIDRAEMARFVKNAFDGREATEAQLKAIFRKLDANSDGQISLNEIKRGVAMLASVFVEDHQHDHSSFADCGRDDM
jgi:glucose-6-phosphate 1-dehydrogenase